MPTSFKASAAPLLIHGCIELWICITPQGITDEVAVLHSVEHLSVDDDDIYLKDANRLKEIPDEAAEQHSLEHNCQRPTTSTSTEMTSSALFTPSIVAQKTTEFSSETQPLVHRCYPARRTAIQASAESNALNVLREFSSPSAPSPTTAPLASPSAPIGASGPPPQQQVQFVANLGLGLASDEQPTNCHSGGRSRKGSYLMQDSLGNTYTKRATGTGHWQCSKKSDGSKNRCAAILVEKEGKFYARGTHRCIKQVSSGLDLPTSSPVASSSSPTSSGSSVNMLGSFYDA